MAQERQRAVAADLAPGVATIEEEEEMKEVSESDHEEQNLATPRWSFENYIALAVRANETWRRLQLHIRGMLPAICSFPNVPYRGCRDVGGP